MAARKKATPSRVENEFNPNSFNAQFAGIHAKLKAQTEHFNGVLTGISEVMKEVREQTTQTNGRVNKLESSRKAQLAWVAGAGAATTILVNVGIFIYQHGAF